MGPADHFRRGRAGHLLVVVLLTVLLPAVPAIGSPTNDEVEAHVKFAFLYNFVRFVQWPSETLADPQSSVTIGIVGRDTLGTILEETVQGKSSGGHPIKIPVSLPPNKRSTVRFSSSRTENS
jgi:hypothetical protein